jgi:glycosyltransferase involved in cell wall biosynthesis
MSEKNQETPSVAVCMVTYNHEKYITQAVESIVSQQTNFPYKLFIGEDCSTDKTRIICLELKEKYPDKIELLLNEKNLGGTKNTARVYAACFAYGKYIAICEGDDYWTDPYKLQKQVDFLEAHEDVVFSCHRYNILNNDTQELKLAENNFFKKNKNSEGYFFSIETAFLKEWITKTLTAVIRVNAMDLNFASQCTMKRDVHLVYGILLRGNGYCHSFTGGVYRIHGGGVFGGKSEIERCLINIKVFREFYQCEKTKLLSKILKGAYSSSFVFFLSQKYFLKPIFSIEYLTFLYLIPKIILSMVFRKIFHCKKYQK